MPRRRSEAGLRITPLFVFNQLADHQKECARRWWSVFLAVIANLIVMLIGTTTMLLTLLSRTAGH